MKYVHGILERKTWFLNRWKFIDAFILTNDQTLVYSDLDPKTGKLGEPKIIDLIGARFFNVTHKGCPAPEIFVIRTKDNREHFFRAKTVSQKNEWIEGLKESLQLSNVIK